MALGFRKGLTQVEVFDLAREVEHTADVLQVFFCKRCHFLQVDVLIDRTRVVKSGLFLKAKEAVETRQNGGFWVANGFEFLQFDSQQVIDAEYHFFSDSYAKYWHCFPQQTHQFLLPTQPPQQLLLFPLAQQLIVSGESLHFLRSSHFEWKILVELGVPKAELSIEVGLQAFLEEPTSCVLQDIHIFLVDGALEAAVVGIK